jgi:hypothetical protein
MMDLSELERMRDDDEFPRLNKLANQKDLGQVETQFVNDLIDQKAACLIHDLQS